MSELTETQKLNRRMNRILEAVEAQARDETLWPVYGESVQTAHVVQSLRWLHELIENDSDVAINNIVYQSKDNL
jgi:hypothetical protein